MIQTFYGKEFCDFNQFVICHDVRQKKPFLYIPSLQVKSGNGKIYLYERTRIIVKGHGCDTYADISLKKAIPMLSAEPFAIDKIRVREADLEFNGKHYCRCYIEQLMVSLIEPEWVKELTNP